MKTTQKYLTTFTLGTIGFSTAIGFSPLGTAANAQVLGSYTFGTTGNQTTAATTTPSTTYPNGWRVTFDNFSAGSGLTNPTYTTGQAGSGYIASGWGTSTYTASVTANDYFQFGLTPIPGNTMNLSSLTFFVTRSGGNTAGPDTLQLAYALGSNSNFTSVGNVISNISSSNYQSQTISWANVPQLTNTSERVTFRLYGYFEKANQVDAAGTLSIDEVAVNGTAVPEPTTILGGMAALSIGGAIQRKRQKARKTVGAKA